MHSLAHASLIPTPNPPPVPPTSLLRPALPLPPTLHRYEGAEEAVRILNKGPEPLTSQFTTSYGLVLNLLSAYTLEDARVFLAK